MAAVVTDVIAVLARTDDAQIECRAIADAQAPELMQQSDGQRPGR
jgi:hypothetical protein